MKHIYFDNGSTTFPKPDSMAKAVYEYMTQTGVNINRGCYNSAYDIEELVFETRQLLCDFFHASNCQNVVFTKNITESMNLILKGFLKAGDHVLVSSMEHNAVMRPLIQLQANGISFTRIPCNEDGTLCLAQLASLIKPETKAIVMTHASNVCGTLLPLEEVGAICHAKNLKFFVDTAQTAGVWPIDMQKFHIDALAFTGHKGLLGPQGIGGFILEEQMVSQMEPLLTGGTGSISHTEEIPLFMPDRFEAGTLNLPGIIGLRASLLWLQETGIDRIRSHELQLTNHFIEGLLSLNKHREKIRILGKLSDTERTGVVSIQPIEKDPAELAYQLDERYQIMTRVGLHCAPSAHKTLHTYPVGTIRFSFGWWNTLEEVDLALTALDSLLNEEN